MKYQVQIFAIVAGVVATTACHTAQLEAENDHEAIDAARATHDVPDEGGEFEVVVSALDTGPLVAVWNAARNDMRDTVPRPIGEICHFRKRHEPAAHLRDAVAAAEAEREQQAIHEAYVAKIREDVLAELGLTPEQAEAMKGKVSK